jgi:2-polyprenyl-3-methyl-5-hydroxy-6-metoxy-1,4-benzoquinol methylase
VIDEFIVKVILQNPSHERFLRDSLQGMRADARESLHNYLEYCMAKGLSIDYLVLSYNTITVDMQVEQIHFRRNKRYRYSTFPEVADRVYFDDNYMRRYMYGLAITSFLWPSHAAIHEFFVRTFPKGLKGAYLEVGPGHGYYFTQAAKMGCFEKMLGVDISASSIALTRDIVAYAGIDSTQMVELIESDFLSMPRSSESYSCIVTGEVLEHVERPERFLQAIADLSTQDTHIYLTSCVNAPAVDHIYLFRDPSEIERMSAENGLEIANRFYAPYPGLTFEESMAQVLPVNVAYVMRKL